MIPAPLVPPRGESGDRRGGGDKDRRALRDMPRGAINAVEQMGAAGARTVALRAEHVAVEQQGRMLAEQIGQPDLLGPEVGADPVEDKVLGHLAAGWQLPAQGGHLLGLAAERDLSVEQGVAGGAILAALT